jgi:hypothetical protein
MEEERDPVTGVFTANTAPKKTKKISSTKLDNARDVPRMPEMVTADRFDVLPTGPTYPAYFSDRLPRD